MSIVTLSLFKAHIGHDEVIESGALGNLASGTDELLQHFIDAAEERVIALLGRPLSDFTVIPASVKQAVLLLAAHSFENREPFLIGVSGSEIPNSVVDYLRPYRIEVTGRVIE
ncbi:hypothetical protein M2360_001031 [Rhizobium sp. SG_E_25_P2]|uniref:head-tail connector protein n=1 Tax=Rhizobium sp. SG_E_25_P2 TaxID=2879942 RepID=UPI002473D516|nr:head-tail connector protein [Rhizobium sp. SG_E_25_P2]MDH6265641.1 hypothetical protein [Rhizobium sp. SG_E_25_P2]